jgi:mono/diheme cytochrome c family protein
MGAGMKMPRVLFCGFMAVALPLSAVRAQSMAVENGKLAATRQCARCHAIGRTGVSPLPEAPVFRTILSRYRREVLEVELIQHIQIGHATMPDFQFNPAVASDLLAYLDSIQVKDKSVGK